MLQTLWIGSYILDISHDYETDPINSKRSVKVGITFVNTYLPSLVAIVLQSVRLQLIT